MIFCYAHREIALPLIISETPSYIRWGYMQRPTARHYVERDSRSPPNLSCLSSKNPEDKEKESLRHKDKEQGPVNQLNKAYMSS